MLQLLGNDTEVDIFLQRSRDNFFTKDKALSERLRTHVGKTLVRKRTRDVVTVSLAKLVHVDARVGPGRKPTGMESVHMHPEIFKAMIERCIFDEEWRLSRRSLVDIPVSIVAAAKKTNVGVRTIFPNVEDSLSLTTHHIHLKMERTIRMDSYQSSVLWPDYQDSDVKSSCTDVSESEKRNGVSLLPERMIVSSKHYGSICTFPLDRDPIPSNETPDTIRAPGIHPYTMSIVVFMMLNVDADVNILDDYLTVKTMLETGKYEDATPRLQRVIQDAVHLIRSKHDPLSVREDCDAVQFADQLSLTWDALRVSTTPRGDANTQVRMQQRVQVASNMVIDSCVKGKKMKIKVLDTDDECPVCGQEYEPFIRCISCGALSPDRTFSFRFDKKAVTPLDLFTTMIHIEKRLCVPGMKGSVCILWDKRYTYMLVRESIVFYLDEVVVPHYFTYPNCRPPDAMPLYPILVRNYFLGNAYTRMSSLHTMVHCCMRAKSGIASARSPDLSPENVALLENRLILLSYIFEKTAPDPTALFHMFREPYVIREGERGSTKVDPTGSFTGRKNTTSRGCLISSIWAFMNADSRKYTKHFMHVSMFAKIRLFMDAAQLYAALPLEAVGSYGPFLPVRAHKFKVSMPDHFTFLERFLERSAEFTKRSHSKNIPLDFECGTKTPCDYLYETCAHEDFPDDLSIYMFLAIRMESTLFFPRSHKLDVSESVSTLKNKNLDVLYEGLKAPFRYASSLSDPVEIGGTRALEGMRLAFMYSEHISFYPHNVPGHILMIMDENSDINYQKEDVKVPYPGSLKPESVPIQIDARRIMTVYKAHFPVARKGKNFTYGRDILPVWKAEVCRGDDSTRRTPHSSAAKMPFVGSADDLLECITIYPITTIHPTLYNVP
jgi:hypothetical protein